jgi:hypothetical protein
LDGAFSSVTAVAVWGNALEVDVVLLESLLKLVGAFIVEDVEVWGVAVGLEVGMQGLPGLSEVTGLAGLEWCGENCIAVVIIYNHDIIVPARGLDWEFSCLV